MPPASLSTLAVMMPGPTTESTATSRSQRDGLIGRRLVELCPASSELSAIEDPLEHVVDGDHAQDLAAVVDHGQREEVVLGRLLGDHLGGGVDFQRRRVLEHQ